VKQETGIPYVTEVMDHTMAEEGSFVINKASTERHMPTISKILGGTPTFRNAGGAVPVVLTPGEAVIPAKFAQPNMPLMYALNGGPGNTSGMGRFNGGKIREQAERNIRGASAYASRLYVPKNFLEDNQVRHVMHNAAILNKLGMSEVESIRTSKRLYDEARQYAYDPKTDTINDDRMREIAEKQTRELDKKIGGGLLKKPLMSGSGKMTMTPTGNRNAAIHPTPSLLATLTKMGFANAGEVKRLQMELFGRSAWDPRTQKWIPNTHGYTTEHSQKAGMYGYSAEGNFNQAQAGNKDINSWTNTFSKLTEDHKNPFKDRLPQTLTERQMAIDTIGKVLGLGTGPGTEERIIKAPLRLRHNFGITKVFMDFLKSKGRRLNDGGMVPGKIAQKLFGGGKAMFLGMPRTIKQVEAQIAAKAAMEKASQAVKDYRFSN
jgi:hypothetical protein